VVVVGTINRLKVYIILGIVHVEQVDWKMNKLVICSIPPNGKKMLGAAAK